MPAAGCAALPGAGERRARAWVGRPSGKTDKKGDDNNTEGSFGLACIAVAAHHTTLTAQRHGRGSSNGGARSKICRTATSSAQHTNYRAVDCVRHTERHVAGQPLAGTWRGDATSSPGEHFSLHHSLRHATDHAGYSSHWRRVAEGCVPRHGDCAAGAGTCRQFSG